MYFLNSSFPGIACSRCAEVNAEVEMLSEQVKRGDALGARVEELKGDLEVGACALRAPVMIVSCLRNVKQVRTGNAGEIDCIEGPCCLRRKECMRVADPPSGQPLSLRTNPARSFKAAHYRK